MFTSIVLMSGIFYLRLSAQTQNHWLTSLTVPSKVSQWFSHSMKNGLFTTVLSENCPGKNEDLGVHLIDYGSAFCIMNSFCKARRWIQTIFTTEQIKGSNQWTVQIEINCTHLNLCHHNTDYFDSYNNEFFVSQLKTVHHTEICHVIWKWIHEASSIYGKR